MNIYFWFYPYCFLLKTENGENIGYTGKAKKRGCVKMMHPLLIHHKAPTFTSWGFDIS